MSIKLISKHRSELMAIAMFWVAIRHSYFPFSNKLINFVLVNCGYGSVDMFLFLSSFGLYFSYKKNPNYFDFVKKRMIRILPYSCIVYLVLFLLGKVNIFETLSLMLGISIFVRKDLYFWFISFIIVLYVLTPVYLKLFTRKPVITTAISITIISAVCLLISEYRIVYMLFRIVIFLIGFVFALLLDKYEDKVSPACCWMLVVLMLAGWIIMFGMYHFYRNDVMHVLPFVFIIPGTCLLFSWLFDKCTILNRILGCLGKYTLQFYLIHEEIVGLLLKYYDELFIPNIGFDWWIYIAGIIIAITISILFKKTVDKLMNDIMKG